MVKAKLDLATTIEFGLFGGQLLCLDRLHRWWRCILSYYDVNVSKRTRGQ
jgi:hypothetical protein